MIKFEANFEWHDKQAVILELEHIGQLISGGYTEGVGWKIAGEEEKPRDEFPRETSEDELAE